MLPEKEIKYIEDYYIHPTHRHLGVARITHFIRQRFTFLKIRTKVTEYIKKCDLC